MDYIESLNTFAKSYLAKMRKSQGLKYESMQPKKLYEANKCLNEHNVKLVGRDFIENGKVVARINIQYINGRPTKYLIVVIA